MLERLVKALLRELKNESRGRGNFMNEGGFRNERLLGIRRGRLTHFPNNRNVSY